MQAAAIHSRAIQLDLRDNVLIALADLHEGERVEYGGRTWPLATGVPAKHKFAIEALAPMNDIIDFDTGDIIAGDIIAGEASVKEAGETLLDHAIRVAGGDVTKSEISSQDNFIPWKRGVSL